MKDHHEWTGSRRRRQLTVAALAGAFFGLFFSGLGSVESPTGVPELHAQATPKVQPLAKPAMPENPFPNSKEKAPALDGGISWINTAGPIELSKLRGKVVLLDFWTYCCINCIHILPDLAKLEAEFPNELVVIGVHSAKFDGEKDTDNIKAAVLRYEVKHPVVNDGLMMIWRNYGIRAWPSRILIDPEGTFIGVIPGEGRLDVIREAIRRLIEYHRAKGTLDTTPLHFELAEYGVANTPLRFPGKVIVDPITNRMYIADSSHHRIVVCRPDTGELIGVIGEGVPELKDGDLHTARFNDPQGMAAVGDILYVADRKNHAIRQVDLAKKTVTTLAGDGRRGYENLRTGPGKKASLASPWDVLLIGDTLYIAMAGSHQLWTLNVKNNHLALFAGDGGEDIVDGSRDEARFAQPSGLASDGRWLYVADSEVSAIRKVGLLDDIVDTVVGEGLFEFGDEDGIGSVVRLQHALGVGLRQGLLFVADTYNNKIKTLDPGTRTAKTFLGEHKAGNSLEPPTFDEPAGLSIVGDTIYLADTNNHRIVAIDVPTKKARAIEIKGLQPPKLPDAEAPPTNAKKVELPALTLKSASALEAAGAVVVPEGTKLNPLAPMTYRIESIADGGKATLLAKGKIAPPQATFTMKAAGIDLTGVKRLRFQVVYYPCETGSEGVCRIQTQIWEAPVSSIDPAAGLDKIHLP